MRSTPLNKRGCGLCTAPSREGSFLIVDEISMYKQLSISNISHELAGDEDSSSVPMLPSEVFLVVSLFAFPKQRSQ